MGQQNSYTKNELIEMSAGKNVWKRKCQTPARADVNGRSNIEYM
ncbi:MAG: hypothetical protein Ct9H300mP2_1270 [Candidatus Neomarinimicrobiota bacterium]|nr:MAG: hypothetical protein Ct9H300mP2_1270 [Candidatus Neomarinimicrobiota bacterium]